MNDPMMRNRSDAVQILRSAIEQETYWANELDSEVNALLDRIAAMRVNAATYRANAKKLQDSLDQLTGSSAP